MCVSIDTLSNFCVRILTCDSNYPTQIPSGFRFHPIQMSQTGGIYSPARLGDAWFPADFVPELHFPAAGLPLYFRQGERRAAQRCGEEIDASSEVLPLPLHVMRF